MRALERWAIRCKSLVQPYFDYRSPLWDNCRYLLPTVNTSASYDIPSDDLIETLSWDTLDKRRLRAKPILMYKILNDDPTTNLRNSFVRRNTNQTKYHLQNNVTDLTLTKPESEFYIQWCYDLEPTCKWSSIVGFNKLIWKQAQNVIGSCHATFLWSRASTSNGFHFF